MPTSSAAVWGAYVPKPTPRRTSATQTTGKTESIQSDLSQIHEVPSSIKRPPSSGFFGTKLCKIMTPILLIAIAATAVAIALPIVFLSNSRTSESTMTTTTSVTMTTTTSATTTTTTNVACGSTCVNTSTSTASRVAFYSFDAVTTDATGNYPASGISSPTYVPGWVGSAISFLASNAQRLSTAPIPLNSRSFTIEFWFYATDIASNWDFSFMGEYQAQALRQCLFLNIRNQRLFFGFFADDTSGVATLAINRWYHAAFVYDHSIVRRYIYLDGILDSQSAANGPLLASGVPFTMGGARIGGSTALDVYYSGYLDHVTVASRVKSPCEIYLDANLACYFTFDSASSLVDDGPNFLSGFQTGASIAIGRVNQALEFSSPSSSIIIHGISALRSEFNVFSISMWIYPTSINGGTLIHASTLSNGQGSCLTMWGLTSTGAVIVNVMNASNGTVSTSSVASVSSHTWTHITQTFSTSNGNRLYVNGILVASTSVPTGRAVGPFVTIGSSPSGTSYCGSGSIVTGQFYGRVDELRVFRVELNPTDICRLTNP